MGDEEISPSCLGTKDYWDRVYVEEYSNYDDHGDFGEIWFGAATVRKIVDWLRNSSHVNKEPNRCKVLDVGCGNGMFLLQLKKLGFESVFGIDYSENAVKLAIRIMESEGVDVQIEVGNIVEMDGSPCTALKNIYEICTDKGTYDAISLDPVDSKGKRLAYINNVSRILHPSTGLLLITSCNWTKEELLVHFSEEFNLLDEIAMPSFQFGGKTGQRVTSLVLQKK